ncbi:WhiB family transcriptional regulator [Streptomyces sp. NPDC055055]
MSAARPCAAEPELWFSTLNADVAKAVKICQSCPMQAECAQYATENNIRWGTWGGTTEKQRRRKKKKRPPLEPAVCGTSLAFWRHRSKREGCETCETWHAAEVEADRRQRLAVEHSKGGTKTGYQLHMRLKEPACPSCREVNRLACENTRKRRAALRTPAT